MLIRTLATLTVALALAANASASQTTPAQPPPDKPAATPAPAAARQNVKLDVTIVDQTEGAEPVRRTVSMIVADRRPARIRTSGSVLAGPGRVDVALNVDAQASVMDDQRIDLDLTLEYAPKPGTEREANGDHPARVSQRIFVIVSPGKPMVVSQASDPIADRRVTVELTATVLK